MLKIQVLFENIIYQLIYHTTSIQLQIILKLELIQL